MIHVVYFHYIYNKGFAIKRVLHFILTISNTPDEMLFQVSEFVDLFEALLTRLVHPVGIQVLNVGVNSWSREYLVVTPPAGLGEAFAAQEREEDGERECGDSSRLVC